MGLRTDEHEARMSGALELPESVGDVETPARFLIAGGDASEEFPVPPASDFLDKNGDAVDFIPAPDVAKVGKALIARRNQLGHLRGKWKIAYRWKASGGQGGGKLTLGKCVKATGLVKHFSGEDFIVWLAADHLALAKLTRFQVEALVWHELCHAEIVENDKGEEIAKVRAHDFEGFRSEIEHYGFWRADIEIMAPVFQMHLDLAGGSDPDEDSEWSPARAARASSSSGPRSTATTASPPRARAAAASWS